jgi:hypothetical protein
VSNFPSVSSTQKWVLNDSRIDKFVNENPSENLTKNNFFFLTRILYIYVIPFSRVIFYYLKQFIVSGNKNKKKITSLILHSGRGYDNNNIQKIFQINTNEMYLIYAFSLTDYMKYEKLSIFILLRNLAKAIADYKSVLTMKFPDEIIGILYENTGNISVFTYLISFFQQFKEKHPGCTVYSSGAILPSHAAILSEYRTINIYHGVMGKINLSTFPEYDSVCVYSYDEKKYFESIGVTSKVYVYPAIKNKLHNKNVILFMADDASRVDSKELSDLIYQFKLHGYSIFMKMHPLHNVSREFKSEYGLEDIEWNNIFDTSELEILSGEDATFVLIEKQPSFVVGWQSTALCEALNSNVIPIMMSDSSRDTSLDVYPAERRALVWPVECNIIKNLLLNYSSYEDTIYMLKTR